MFPTADCGSDLVEHPDWNAHASIVREIAAIRRRDGTSKDVL